MKDRRDGNAENSRANIIFEHEAGNIFGVIPKKHAPDWLVGEQVLIRQAKGSDGSLTAIVERL